MHDNGTLTIAYGSINEPNNAWYRTLRGGALSDRHTIATDGNYSDSAQLPARVGDDEYPVLLHNRDTGVIRVVTLSAEITLPFGYLGDIEITAAYLGDTPITLPEG